MFCEKGVLRNFIKFTGKHLCQSLFFNKVAGLRWATLLKNKLWHRCFPVNFAKFLRTPFLTEHLWLLLLTQQYCQMICKPYYLDKQHANISPLILMTNSLLAMHCSQKTTFHFLTVFNVHTCIISVRNHFCGIFLNSHKYFQDIFLRRIKDVTESSF